MTPGAPTCWPVTQVRDRLTDCWNWTRSVVVSSPAVTSVGQSVSKNNTV